MFHYTCFPRAGQRFFARNPLSNRGAWVKLLWKVDCIPSPYKGGIALKIRLSEEELKQLNAFLDSCPDAERLSAREAVLDLYDI